MISLEPRQVAQPFVRRWLRSSLELVLRSPGRFGILIAVLESVDSFAVNLASDFHIEKMWIDTLGQFLNAFERSLPLKRPSGLARQEVQLALLKESGTRQRLVGTTAGIKQILEYAAIAAIQNEEERITVPLLGAWRHMFEIGEGRSRVSAG